MSAERLREAADRREADADQLDLPALHRKGLPTWHMAMRESERIQIQAEWRALAAWLRTTERDTGSSSTAYKAAEVVADALLGGAA